MNNLRNKKRHEVTESEMCALNWKREAMVKAGKDMSPAELKEVLQNLNYATSGNFIKCITSGENPPIIRVSRGRYAFNPKPIHIDRMRKVWHDYCFYGRNRPDKDSKTLSLDISRAITLLKSQGYKVLKPVTQYEEV